MTEPTTANTPVESLSERDERWRRKVGAERAQAGGWWQLSLLLLGGGLLLAAFLGRWGDASIVLAVLGVAVLAGTALALLVGSGSSPLALAAVVAAAVVLPAAPLALERLEWSQQRAWSSDDGLLAAGPDRLITADGGGLRARDIRDGAVLWERDIRAESGWVLQDLLVVRSGEALVGLGLADGLERWRARQPGAVVAVGEDAVVVHTCVQGACEVVALSRTDGQEIWAAPTAEQEGYVGLNRVTDLPFWAVPRARHVLVTERSEGLAVIVRVLDVGTGDQVLLEQGRTGDGAVLAGGRLVVTESLGSSSTLLRAEPLPGQEGSWEAVSRQFLGTRGTTEMVVPHDVLLTRTEPFVFTVLDLTTGEESRVASPIRLSSRSFLLPRVDAVAGRRLLVTASERLLLLDREQDSVVEVDGSTGRHALLEGSLAVAGLGADSEGEYRTALGLGREGLQAVDLATGKTRFVDIRNDGRGDIELAAGRVVVLHREGRLSSPGAGGFTVLDRLDPPE